MFNMEMGVGILLFPPILGWNRFVFTVGKKKKQPTYLLERNRVTFLEVKRLNGHNRVAPIFGSVQGLKFIPKNVLVLLYRATCLYFILYLQMTFVPEILTRS